MRSCDGQDAAGIVLLQVLFVQCCARTSSILAACPFSRVARDAQWRSGAVHLAVQIRDGYPEVIGQSRGMLCGFWALEQILSGDVALTWRKKLGYSRLVDVDTLQSPAQACASSILVCKRLAGVLRCAAAATGSLCSGSHLRHLRHRTLPACHLGCSPAEHPHTD
jgi:hypothetical protein